MAMTATPVNEKMRGPASDYALGYSESEHERLIRQAALIAPITERLFREAGIGPGQRVLDLGSGMGDVFMLAAMPVRPRSGRWRGRDAGSIARAKVRVTEAGLRNLTFTQGDVNQIVGDQPFDAIVGRFILMFLSDPLSVLKSVARLVRPGGVLAFQEPSWAGMLAMAMRLPLWSCVRSTIHETFLHAGANPEMGLDLHSKFQQIGLTAPSMRLDMLLSTDARFTGIVLGVLCSIRPLAEKCGVFLAELGDFDTLPERIQSEITATGAVVSVVPIVSAWSRKPEH